DAGRSLRSGGGAGGGRVDAHRRSDDPSPTLVPQYRARRRARARGRPPHACERGRAALIWFMRYMGSHTIEETSVEGLQIRLVMDGLRRIVRGLRTGASEAERRLGLSGAQLFVLEQ